MKLVYFLLTAVAFVWLGCQPRTVKPPVAQPAPITYTIPNDSGKVKVVLKTENVREAPNGVKIGTIRKGEKITVIRRVGNWVEFDSRYYVGGFLWAPSLGYPYINLYSPAVYYDSTRQQFKSPHFFQQLFSQSGDTIETSDATISIFFTNIGLGSHTETEVEVVTAKEKVVHHGVTIHLDPQTHHIVSVKIDFYRPITGVATALQKCQLPQRSPDEVTASYVAWHPGTLLTHLGVRLERQEWQSDRFVAVVYQQNTQE